jgi:hypothetical protein
MSMNGAKRPAVIRTTCPIFGTHPTISEHDTVIVLQPEIAMMYPCADCGDTHIWHLTVDRYDFLVMRGYDIAAAINGEELYVAEPVRP